MTEIEEIAKNPKIVAIGEIGLDYHYDFSPRDVQISVLKAQLKLAHKLKMPVILHNRESTADIISVLSDFNLAGVMHCFSGSVQTAKTVLDMGLHLGFGGTLTFENAKKTVEVAKFCPLERILLETDCPYLAPTPVRGTRNEPKNVRFIARFLAEIKGISFDEVCEVTSANARRLFGI